MKVQVLTSLSIHPTQTTLAAIAGKRDGMAADQYNLDHNLDEQLVYKLSLLSIWFGSAKFEFKL